MRVAARATRTVVQRDGALLTTDEVQKHGPEVMVAIKQELETWVKHGCISRRTRTLARNIIDAKWVAQWTVEQDASSVHKHSNQDRQLFGK